MTWTVKVVEQGLLRVLDKFPPVLPNPLTDIPLMPFAPAKRAFSEEYVGR